MLFDISQDIFEKFPDTRIGIVIAKDLDNRSGNMEIAELLEKIQIGIKNNFDINALTENPSIAVWRKVYSEFGSKPRDFRSSIEALIRSVLNGRDVRSINKLVDIYNYASLKYILPVGGEDLDKVEGNLHLKFADGSEKFIPLGSNVEETAYEGEVIYCDDGKNVLCRRWNWRESDRTKITESTSNAIIVIEGFDEKVDEAVKDISLLVEKFCSCRTQTFITNKNNHRVEW